MNFARQWGGNLRRPGGEQQAGDLVGKIARIYEAGNGSDDDEKRKHRHQDRQRDMAGDRPTVVAVEAVERVDKDAHAQTDLVHCMGLG
jgi:hypothetical protein